MNTQCFKKSLKFAGLPLFFAASSVAAAPIAQSDRLHTTVGVPKTVGVLWNDRGTRLHVSKVNHYSAQGGRAYVVSGKHIHYTPKPGFRGTDTFWYEIKDAHGRTNSAKVTVSVKSSHQPKRQYQHKQRSKQRSNYNIQLSQPGFSINYSKSSGAQVSLNTQSGMPIGHPDAFTTQAASGQVALHVLSNDQGHGLKVHKTNPWTGHGGQAWVVNNSAGSYIMYKPKHGFVGTDELWYVLRDANGRTNSTKVNVTVW